MKNKSQDMSLSCDSLCRESTTTSKLSCEKPSSHFASPATDSSLHEPATTSDALHTPILLNHPLLLQAQTAAQNNPDPVSPVQTLSAKEAAAAAAFAQATCRLHEASTLATAASRHLISWSREVATATGRPQTDVSALQIILDIVLLDLRAMRIIAGSAAETRRMLVKGRLLRPLEELALPPDKPFLKMSETTMATTKTTMSVLGTCAVITAAEFYTFTEGATSQTRMSMPFDPFTSRYVDLEIDNRKMGIQWHKFQSFDRDTIKNRVQGVHRDIAVAKELLVAVLAAQEANKDKEVIQQRKNDGIPCNEHQITQTTTATTTEARAKLQAKASAAIDEMVKIIRLAVKSQRIYLGEIKALVKAATFHYRKVKQQHRLHQCIAGCKTVMHLLTSPGDLQMQNASALIFSRASIAEAERRQQQPAATAGDIGELLRQARAACRQAMEAATDAEAISHVADSQARLNTVPGVQQ